MLQGSDTTAPLPATEPSRLGAQQFSLRSLFVLTLVVALYLTISVLSQDSAYLRVFSSPWTAFSLLPIAALWLCHRWNLLTTRHLVVGSFVAYLVALTLPALHFEDDMQFGWLIWCQSFVFGPGELYEKLYDMITEDPPVTPGNAFALWLIGPITISPLIPLLCTMGAIANFAYLTALPAFAWFRKRKRLEAFAHWAAPLAAILSVIVVIPICMTEELDALYPGYGLWTASICALAIATRRNIPPTGWQITALD
jgi:hypothetical protein